MLRVEIWSHSHADDAAAMPWVDHLKNPINKLVFSKEYHEQYVPGHYPLESFGSLYRNIDDFSQSPIQSLSDWEIRLPAVYSSPDGYFQTVDLFCWLESVNEDFDLLGCEAVLLDGDRVVFKGAVEAVESGTGGAAISISERLGSPEIGKSDFPFVFGYASLNRWPVKIAKEKSGQYTIEISQLPLERFDGFFVYLEKRNEFAPASFGSIEFSHAWTKAFLSRPGDYAYGAHSYPHDIGIGEPFEIHAADMTEARPEPQKNEPDYYIAASNDNLLAGEWESVQAWSSRRGSGGDYPTAVYVLGRDISDRQLSHQIHGEGSVSIIRKLDIEKTVAISMRDCPESLTLNEPDGNVDKAPYSRGNPSAFLALSAENIPDWGSGRYDKPPPNLYPEVFYPAGSLSPSDIVFTVNFPELDLPSDAVVFDLVFHIRLFWNFTIKRTFQSLFVSSSFLPCEIWIEDKKFSFSIPSFEGDVSTQRFEIYNGIPPDWGFSLQDTRSIKLKFKQEAFLIKEGGITLMAACIEFKARCPLSGIKLYASGEFAANSPGSDSVPDSGKSIVASVYGLLAAANVEDYQVSPMGELSDVEYGSIASGGAVSLRNELRALAFESGTLIKFAPAASELLIKSVSMEHEEGIRESASEISVGMLVLENNIYSFKMESASRNDVASGVSLLWGKDTATGEYKHSFKIDSTGAYKDGEFCPASELSVSGIAPEKWEAVTYGLPPNGFAKNFECGWILDWQGAMLFAYNYLCWNSRPLRKAGIRCVSAELGKDGKSFDIGDFAKLCLPGYPPAMEETHWVITGRNDDLDKGVSDLELLEAWALRPVPETGFLLLENGGYILLEDEEKIKLEVSHG